MKKCYLALFSALAVFGFVLPSSGAEPTNTDVLTLKSMPEGRYSVTLELKQLDGKPATVELAVKGGRIASAGEGSGRLGRIEGKAETIGNGVFMVMLSGTGYRATQFWVFRPDGSAQIKEIPDRGEKQVAKPMGSGSASDSK